MIVDPDGLTSRERYRLLISALVPRPIAWVTTLSENGGVNAAPFSFFGGISASPPLVAVSVGRRPDGTPKDTLANARRTGQMVVNMVPYDLREEMVRSSRPYPPGVSEVEQVGLETAESQVVAPPRLAASPVNLECEVERTIDFGGTTMIVGRVVRFHLRDDVVENGLVAFEKLRPLGRLGGIEYLDHLEGVVEIPSAK
jgi:flavin reductase (DIM6/NTAB) family NADH-FMN oxidoreductase RutF